MQLTAITFLRNHDRFVVRVIYDLKEFVGRHASVVDGAAVVVADGNLPPKGFREVARLSARKEIPLVFEPTSVAKCSVPFLASVSQFNVLFFCSASRSVRRPCSWEMT